MVFVTAPVKGNFFYPLGQGLFSDGAAHQFGLAGFIFAIQLGFDFRIKR